MATQPPKVFISYSHDSSEHIDRVLHLADRLRTEGVDAQLDQYEVSPDNGWPQWMRRQIKNSDFVIVVCTATYKRRFEGEEESETGKGATWEGAILTQDLYDAEEKKNRLVPVYFITEDRAHVPSVLRGLTSYHVSSSEGYKGLYRWLTDQPAIVKPVIGKSIQLELDTLEARERQQDFKSAEASTPNRDPDKNPDQPRNANSLWRGSMHFPNELARFFVQYFTIEELKRFIRDQFKNGDEIVSEAARHETSFREFVDGVLAAIIQSRLLGSDDRLRILGKLMLKFSGANKAIDALVEAMRKDETLDASTSNLPPLSYGAAAGELKRFVDVLDPPDKILEPQCDVGRGLPAVEFVRGPRTERGENALDPDLAREVLIHTIHAGHLIPNSIVADPEVEGWFESVDQREAFREEKDWGANQLAEAIANELGLDGYLRVNVARSVLDFGRFPGVSPHGSEHLLRLSVSSDLGEHISRGQVDWLLELYHKISSAFERAVWIDAESDGSMEKRPRRIILGIHTYDKYNKEGTLRPPVSLISRSRTYDLNRTMHPGSFDRLYPDELAEFTADRCLLAAIAHSLERDRIGVADNHPYSMPDGCVEIRSQVWYFFKHLQQRFQEAQDRGTIPHIDGLSDVDFRRVWDMLLDTTLRHTESASLRSYVHRHRVSMDSERKDEFERYGRAYRAIEEFRDKRKLGKTGRSELIDEYRRKSDRPSSLGLEVRKDLVWMYKDAHDDLNPRLIRWKIPVEDSSAVILENVYRIARLIASGIKEYLMDDQLAKMEAKELFDQTSDR